MADMGTFRTTIAIENPLARGRRHELPETLVDTGAELTWAPALVLESLGIARQKRLGFRTADGRGGGVPRYRLCHRPCGRYRDE